MYRPNSWAHRKWVSKQIINVINQMCCMNASSAQDSHNATTTPTTPTSTTTTTTIILNLLSQWTNKEIEVCTTIAENKPKNYYAWTHRRFVIDTIIQNTDEITKATSSTTRHGHTSHSTNNDLHHFNSEYQLFVCKMLESEFQFIHSTWIVKHVSDHSAVHYGGEILRIMLLLRMSSLQLINADDEEDDTNTSRATSLNDISGINTRSSSSLRSRCFFDQFHHRYSAVVGLSLPWRMIMLGDDDNKGNNVNDILKCIEGTMDSILSTSLTMIAKYPSNEVIWVWRRICSQIYIDYFIVKHHQEQQQQQKQQQQHEFDELNARGDKERKGEGMTSSFFYQFVTKEIENIHVNNPRHEEVLEEDKYEKRRYQLYSSTYILWLIEYMRKNYKCISSINSSCLPMEIDELERRFIAELQSSHEDESISIAHSNFWQLKE